MPGLWTRLAKPVRLVLSDTGLSRPSSACPSRARLVQDPQWLVHSGPRLVLYAGRDWRSSRLVHSDRNLSSGLERRQPMACPFILLVQALDSLCLSSVQPQKRTGPISGPAQPVLFSEQAFNLVELRMSRWPGPFWTSLF